MGKENSKIIKTNGCTPKSWLHWLMTEKDQKEKLIIGVATTDDELFHPIIENNGNSENIIYESIDTKGDKDN